MYYRGILADGTPLLNSSITPGKQFLLMQDELSYLAQLAISLDREAGTRDRIVFCIEMCDRWSELVGKISGKTASFDISFVGKMDKADPFLKGICGPHIYQTAFKAGYDEESDSFMDVPENVVRVVFFSGIGGFVNLELKVIGRNEMN